MNDMQPREQSAHAAPTGKPGGAADRSPRRAHRMMAIGIGLGICFWLLDSFLDAFVFHNGSLAARLLPLGDANEMWGRSEAIIVLIGFGAAIFRLASAFVITLLGDASDSRSLPKVFFMGHPVTLDRCVARTCWAVNDCRSGRPD